MKSRDLQYYLIVFSVFLALIFVSGCEDLDGVIEGTATDEDTGESISNARILTVSSKDSTMLLTRTDNSGFYRIRGARFGKNLLRIWKDGYENEKKFADVPDSGTVTIDFELASLKIKASIVLTIKITDEDGDPVTGATVDLYKEVPAGNVFAGTEITEDADGMAIFHPGYVEKGETITFEVRVAARGFLNTRESFNLEWTHAHPSWVVQLQKI